MFFRQIDWCDDKAPKKGIAWCAAVHGVAEPQIQLSDWTDDDAGRNQGAQLLYFKTSGNGVRGGKSMHSEVLNTRVVFVQSLNCVRHMCPSASPGACSGSCALSQWCRQAFLLCCPLLLVPSVFYSVRSFQWVDSLYQVAKELELQCRSFQWIFRTDFLLNWLVGSPCNPRDSRVFSNTTVHKHQLFGTQPSLWSNSHIHTYMTTGKTIALTIQTFVDKVISLLFNMLSRFVIAFLPRSKCLLISWLQSPSAIILEPPKIKSLTVSIVSPSTCHEVMGPDAMILVFWMLSFKPTFSLSSFTFIRRQFSHSLLSAIKMAICISELIDVSPCNLDLACASSSPAFHVMYSAC